MARDFTLPDLGEGIHEGEVIAVLVDVGQDVREGDPVLEVETDKAAVELPSPVNGRVEAIHVKAGDVAHVGDVLMTFDEEAGQRRSAPPEPAGKAEKAPSTAADTGEAAAAAPRSRNGVPVPASPATRRLARELGVILADVTPTGPGGRVTADDVRRFAETGGPEAAAEAPWMVAEPETETVAPPTAGPGDAPPLPDFSKWGPVEKLPLRSIRKATARRMALAWSQIPHVASQDAIDVTRLEALQKRQKEAVADAGGNLTLTAFAVKAAAAALKRFPQFNVSIDTQNGTIIQKRYVHIGVATDTGEGLVVPVIRDADQKSVTGIAVALGDLVRRTRERKIGLDELRGGTFTITNIGAAGGRGHFAPMINYPEAAILGMSAARLQPVVHEKPEGGYTVAARRILPVVLAIDHRVLDGVDATQFLTFFRELLENPERFLVSI